MFESKTVWPTWSLLVIVLATFVAAGPEARRTQAQDAVAETTTELRETLSYLAADEREGRGIGTKGLEEAAEFLAKEFREIGLKTDLVDGTPFQPFDVNVSSELGAKENNTLRIVSSEKPDEAKELLLGKDFQPLALGGSGKFDAPLVFVGYGITAPKLEYDEYAGPDVKGKMVVILRKEPQQNNPHSVFDGTRPSQHALFSRKVSNAYQQGAAGVILINDTYGLAEERIQVEAALETALNDLTILKENYAKKDNRTPEEIEQYYLHVASLGEKIAEYGKQLTQPADSLLPLEGGGNETSRPDFPVIFAKREAFEPLIEKQFGQSLKDIETAIDAKLEPIVGELPGWKGVGQTEVVRETARIRNVLAMLETPHAASDQVIVVAAHYDHLGMGGPGSLAPLTTEIHNGADDNASGTTALLEVARRMHAVRDQLKHSVLFIAFTGEERGLLGSAHYVKEPIVPIDKTLMMLNMDMVGRLTENKLIVMGSGTAAMFDAMLDRLNETHKFELSKDPGGFGPSDHSSFYAKQVPVLALFTGTHNDYHRPSDDADKINYDGMQRIIAYGVDILRAIDRAEDKPQYVAVESKRPEMRGGSRPYFGSIPDFTVVEGGYGIQGVSPGSPAADAGLQAGDVLIDLGGNRIGGLEDFDSALRKFKAGDKVDAIVKRGDKEVSVTITLAPPR